MNIKAHNNLNNAINEIKKTISEFCESYEDYKKINSQNYKTDAGKPMCRLVPSEIVRAIARVREYGLEKYHDPDNWKLVEKERYQDATYRHLLAYIDDSDGLDDESGLPHLWHLACNVAFLCEMQKEDFKEEESK